MCNKNDLYTCSISLGAFTYETSIRSTNYVHCVRRTVYYAQIYSIYCVNELNLNTFFSLLDPCQISAIHVHVNKETKVSFLM